MCRDGVIFVCFHFCGMFLILAIHSWSGTLHALKALVCLVWGNMITACDKDDVSDRKVDFRISILPAECPFFHTTFDNCWCMIKCYKYHSNKMLKAVPTCLPGGAWVGALGPWADPFEEKVGVGQVSSYHGLKNTSFRVTEVIRTEWFGGVAF